MNKKEIIHLRDEVSKLKCDKGIADQNTKCLLLYKWTWINYLYAYQH